MQPNPTTGGGALVGSPSVALGVEDADNGQKVEVEAPECRDSSAPNESTENVPIFFWLVGASLKPSQAPPGIIVVSEGRQNPSANHSLGTLVQITCKQIISERSLITFFFFHPISIAGAAPLMAITVPYDW